MIDTYVSFQVGLNFHSMVTIITLIGLLSSVGSDVTSKVAICLEGCSTIRLLARKGSIASVGAKVDGELATVLAPVRADLAVVWPLVCVNAHVLPKCAAVHCFVRAGSTREWLVPGVHLHVSVQLVLPSKSISTKMAGKWLLSSMFCHMSREILGIFGGEQATHKSTLVNLPATRVSPCFRSSFP